MTNSPYNDYHDDLMGLIEGTLDDQGRERLRRAVECDPVCREECAWFQQAQEDLEAMGDVLVAIIPAVNLVGPVMEAVARIKAESKVVSLKIPRPRRPTRVVASYAWALAAALLFLLGAGLYYTLTRAGEPSPQQRMAEPVRPAEPYALPGTGILREFDDTRGKLPETPPRMELARPQEAVKPEESEGTPKTMLAALTLEDVIAARKDAATDSAAWARLRGWAHLQPEEAQTIVLAADEPTEAVVGAAQAMKAADAGRYLFEAVGHFPKDPYVRMELAKTYLEEPETPKNKNMDAQLSALHELDPDNALTYYIEALALLREGDPAGIELLAQARELDSASAYPLTAAKYREQALVAGGMDPDVARVLTALNSGVDEGDFLRDIANELLQYGQSYEDQGDLQTAQQVYEAVRQLGLQLDTGAQLSQEQLAALDIQRAAAEMLGEVYTLLGDTESLEALESYAVDLVSDLRRVVDFVNSLNEMFSQPLDLPWLVEMAGRILTGGDLRLFE